MKAENQLKGVRLLKEGEVNGEPWQVAKDESGRDRRY